MIRSLTNTITRRSFSSSPHLKPGSSIAVTGASGYIGSFVVQELLSRGYEVRACIQTKEEANHLLKLPNARDNLFLVTGCDLDKTGSYEPAFREAEGVIHTAAKVALGDGQDIVDVSVLGTKNILASIDNCPSIKHYAHTSSCAAIQTFDVPESHLFTEKDWNNWSTLERGDAYGVAKTQAEKVVWEHFRDGDTRTAACLNPNVNIGPVMTKQHSIASVLMLRDIIYGNKTLMYSPWSFVDVRDVAIGHVEALIRPEANRRRFILVGDSKPCDQRELAKIAGRELRTMKFSAPVKVPVPVLQNVIAPLSRLPIVGKSIMSEFARELSSQRVFKYDNSAARDILGINFRSIETSVKEGVESMVEQGFAKPKYV